MARVDPRTVYDYLVSEHGVSTEAAAGILANIDQESGFRTDVMGDGGTSGGLFQHHAGRLTNLKRYAARQGRRWTDWKAQVDFAMSEAAGMNIDLQADDARSAARAWTLVFERPANARQRANERAARVDKYRFGGAGGGSSQPPQGGGGQPGTQPPDSQAEQPDYVPYRVSAALGDFMGALMRRESGGDYNFRSRVGNRVGAYGFREDAWADLATFAGIPDADPRDPRAQDRVAAYSLAELYRRFGSWPLVATAWGGGIKAAQLAMSMGFNDDRFQQLEADGERIFDYVRDVMADMEAQPLLELPDPSTVVLAPATRPGLESRRDRVSQAGLALLRSTRPSGVEAGIESEVARAQRAQEAQRPTEVVEESSLTEERPGSEPRLE